MSKHNQQLINNQITVFFVHLTVINQ